MKELCVFVLSTLLISEITCLIDRNRVYTCQVSLDSVREILQNLTSKPECGEGLWYPVVSLDMSNSEQQCPSPWLEESSPARSCKNSSPGSAACVSSSVYFPVSWAPYRRVCGRITGYSLSSTDAFDTIDDGINGGYVDGVSVTHGMPRQHIWSFGASGFKFSRCPCENGPLSPPLYVGENYFCDDQRNGAVWDAMECTTACCSFNSPPWFSVTLPLQTSDDIEVRICTDEIPLIENVLVSLIEFYVQ